MSKPAATPAPSELLDRWLAHHQHVGSSPQDVDLTPAVGEGSETRPAATAPSGIDAGRAVLAALSERPETPDDPAGTTDLPGHREPAAGASAAAPETAPPATASAPSRPPTQRRAPVTPPPGPVRFPPRRGGRRVLTALAVLALGGAALAAYVAWDQRTPVATGAAVALGVLAWLLRAARALVPGTEVSIEDGVLRIVRGPSRHQFPLTGTHPPIDVLGAPGERGGRC